HPVQLFDPVTHAAMVNNQIGAVNPAAAQLLNFMPAPNLPGDSRNFHFVSASPSDMDTGFLRFNHSFSKPSGNAIGDFKQAVAGMHGTDQTPAPRPGGGRKGQRKGDPSHWTQSINGGLIYNNIRNTVLN